MEKVRWSALRPLPSVFDCGDGVSTRRWQLLSGLLLYSFSSQFLPIEPYLVPYLTSVKNFTNFQIMYGFGMASRLVFSSYMFNLLAEEEYQAMTSLTTTTSLLSFMLASELGQFLALQEVAYNTFFIITLTSLGICSFSSLLLPKEHSLTSVPWQTEDWSGVLMETWHGRSLQILSLWSALSYAGFSLIQNYGTNLFDAVSPTSKFNGHILAASQAAGSLGSFSAIYLESFAKRSGIFIYVAGSALVAVVCLLMGFSARIWVTYLLYVIISGIYQALACLVSVQCGKLLSNGQYILLFSVNNFFGLLLETALQAAIEIAGLSVFAQFKFFSVFFFIATGIFIGFSSFDSRRRQPTNRPLQ